MPRKKKTASDPKDEDETPKPLTALMRAGRKQHAGWTLDPGVKGERPFLQPRGCDTTPL